MMQSLRRSSERGQGDYGWLKTRYSFSFAEYFDRVHMGFRSLRVINEDWVVAGGGFPEHPHRDMEIITYVISGAIEHRDSMGNRSVISAGEVQRMTAGSGVTHSEFNPSADEDLHLLQIWIKPQQRGLAPSYESRPIGVHENPGVWQLVASPDGRNGSLKIHQDALLHAIQLQPNQQSHRDLASKHGDHSTPGETGKGGHRGAWIQVISGGATVGDFDLSAGDGLALNQIDRIDFAAGSAGCELLMFDLS